VNTSTRYRYPGPPEFEDTPEDRGRFFGRQRETNTVAERIIASRLLVVYGNSGLGKSSLLKAGVFPKLRQEGLLPIRLRLDSSLSALELVRRACEEEAERQSIDYTPGGGDTAWEFFKTAMFWCGERCMQPVLVCDQFEEIFTLADAKWRKAFAEEIGPLACGNVPPGVRERLKTKELGLGEQPPKVKVVFSLREESYGCLQELSSDFPGLFQERFRLKALDEEQAKLAILEPAQKGGGDFATPPFDYEPEALDGMLAFLKGKSQAIEPFQLQLLCQHIERAVVAEKRKSQEPGLISVESADLGGPGAMERVLKLFYDDSLSQLPPEQRARARKLCDTGLLSASGRRLMLEQGEIERNYGVTPGTLRVLADERRILRQEPRLGGAFYEISHDTMADSIYKSRKWRMPAHLKWTLRAVPILICILVYALHEAKQAKEANAESKKTVAFLMGEDFLAALRPIGKLEAFEKIRQAVPCKDSEKGIDRDDIALRNLGLACMNEGDVDYQKFDLEKAEKAYESARRHFTLNGTSLNNPDLADALVKLANVAEDKLELDKASKLVDQALTIHEHPAPSDDDPDEIARDRATSYQLRGDVKREQGYLSAAMKDFDKALQLFEAAPGAKASTEWLYLAQDALLGRGQLLELQGNQKDSDAAFADMYKYAKSAVERSPFAPEARRRKGIALSYRSHLAQANKETLSGESDEIDEIFEDINRATDWDPKNKVWQWDLAFAHLLRADALAKREKWEDAAQDYLTAIRRLEVLRKLAPANRQIVLDLVRACERLGMTYQKQSRASATSFSGAVKSNGEKSQDALAQFEKAQNLLDTLAGLAPQVKEIRDTSVELAIRMADVQTSEETLKACERVAPYLLDQDKREAPYSYWELTHQLAEKCGDALLAKGDTSGALERFAAASGAIDWLLTNRPLTAAQLNDKFLLFYEHFAPLRQAQEDKAGEASAYREAVKAAKQAVSYEPTNQDYQRNLALGERAVGQISRFGKI
jgi:tetratricopeptide (TPR) repeat protein